MIIQFTDHQFQPTIRFSRIMLSDASMLRELTKPIDIQKKQNKMNATLKGKTLTITVELSSPEASSSGKNDVHCYDRQKGLVSIDGKPATVQVTVYTKAEAAS